MARGSREVGIIKSIVLGAVLAAGLATAAQAGDNKLAFTGSALIGTDYMFRSVSNTNSEPTAQVEFDATYGMLYAYIWGSNTALSGNNIEIDYGVGITPKWGGIDFNIAGLYYTDPGTTSLNYFELRTSAAHTFDKLTLSIGNWWSPDNFGAGIWSDAVEFGAAYAFAGKLFNFFSPSISGVVGEQFYETNLLGGDYTYWNAGLTLGFLDHWSADIRYYDTDFSDANCFLNVAATNSCDARVVGAIKATF